MLKLTSFILFSFSLFAQQPVIENNIRSTSASGCGAFSPTAAGRIVCSLVSWFNLSNPPFTDPRIFNFTPRTPGGSLIIGSNVITLNPMPTGITSLSVTEGAQLYIQHGTGTAESVPITAFSATTVTVLCAHTHTGAWTIGSNSTGIQEAATFAASNGVAEIYLPAGTYTLFGTVNVSASANVTIRGAGREVTTIRMDSSNTLDNAFNIASPIFNASDFRLDFGGNQAGPWSTGNGFNFTFVGVIYHLNSIENYSFAKAVESIGQHGFTSIVDMNLSGHDYGLRLRGGGGQYFNINSSVASTGTGIDISPTQADRAISGIMFNNIWISGGITGFRGSSAIAAINEGFIDNMYSDTVTNDSLLFMGGAFTIANWRIGHIDLLGASVGIALDSTNTPGVIENVRFTGGQVSAVNVAFLSWAANNITASNISFRMTADATVSSIGIDLHGGAFHTFSLDGCSVGLAETGGVTGARPATGLQFGTGAAENLSIVNTPMYASSTLFDTSLNPTITKTVISNNPGIDDITGTTTVSGGGAAAFPFNPSSTMNSATAVSSVTGLWAGRRNETFVNTNATPGAWTAGATIGNSCTIAQNKLYTYWFDGTKIWLNGPGC